ncbi:unnamed protein product [Clonostachys rhizophaga]|uniref:Uncharacterized protein n=1 Tax=Clonostachys rhizophaga TaxID=160324 RepID=A0A9N9VNF2_9HYPO|nr:unnamed protein product [Clonostachys rhizophaga]
MSGGFYKYRCKFFYSHNCTNWVWMNESPCAPCLAEGREETGEAMASRHPGTIEKDSYRTLGPEMQRLFFGVAPNILNEIYFNEERSKCLIL